MHSRRSFLKTTAVYSAGILAAPSISNVFAAGKPPIGLQLYTVRDAMAKDPKGTLAKVAEIGFNSLEGATYTGTETFYGMDPRTFAGVLRSNNQVMRSCHYRLGEDGSGLVDPNKGTVLHDWDKAVADAHTLGIRYMVCAWLSPKERLGLDHYKKMADEFNLAGEKCDWIQKAQQEWAKEPVKLDTITADGIKDLVRNGSDKLRLINVWATWCGPCVAEFPDLVDINRMYRRRDFEFISISADEPAKRGKALQFLQKSQASNTNYIFNIDDKYKLIEAIDPKWQGALPYTLVVEPGGRIIYAKEGPVDAAVLKKTIVDDPVIGRYY